MMPHPTVRSGLLALLAGLLLITCSCGYHTSAHAVRLPSDLQTLYVPAFSNATNTYHIEQTVTAAVVRELRSRTNYRIITTNDGTADATLSGTVILTGISPLTYDSQTGRISSSLVVVSLSASLVSKTGKVLWSNPNYIFRDQYQVTSDLPSFFEEETPALQRMATDFSRTLVSEILEAY